MDAHARAAIASPRARRAFGEAARRAHGDALCVREARARATVGVASAWSERRPTWAGAEIASLRSGIAHARAAVAGLRASLRRPPARRLFGDAAAVVAMARAAIDVLFASGAGHGADDRRAVAFLRAAERAAVGSLVALRAERFAERLALALLALGLAQAAAARAPRRACGIGGAARRKTAARVRAGVFAELVFQIDILDAARSGESEHHERERAQLHGSSTPMRTA